MTLARLDHPAHADEVLDLLAARARPSQPGRDYHRARFWSDGVPAPGHGAAVETTAPVTLAFAGIRPAPPTRPRPATGCSPTASATAGSRMRPRGRRCTALASRADGATAAEDRYRLVVTVNDARSTPREVAAGAEGGPRDPRSLRGAKAGGENRVAFDIEGRGTFGYAVTLSGVTRDFGPEQAAGRTASSRRSAAGSTWPARPSWTASRSRRGSAGDQPASRSRTRRPRSPRRPGPRRDRGRTATPGGAADLAGRLLVSARIPARGHQLVRGLGRSARRALHTSADGVLTVFFTPDGRTISGSLRAPRRPPGALPRPARVDPQRRRSRPQRPRPARPDLEGPPPRASRAPTPSRRRPTSCTTAARPTSTPAGSPRPPRRWSRSGRPYTPPRRRGARTRRGCCCVRLARHDAREVVRDFECGEKVARAVRRVRHAAGRSAAPMPTSARHERAYLGWTALAEASYLEDARIGEVLRQRGRTREGRRVPARLSLASRPADRCRHRLLRPGAPARRLAADRPAVDRERVRPVPPGQAVDRGLPGRVAEATRWPSRPV